MLSGAFSISFMTFPALSTRSDSLSCAKSGQAKARAGIKLSSLFIVHPQILSGAAALCGRDTTPASPNSPDQGATVSSRCGGTFLEERRPALRHWKGPIQSTVERTYTDTEDNSTYPTKILRGCTPRPKTSVN